jgi:tetratricopeptide (TPR) repeat protein
VTLEDLIEREPQNAQHKDKLAFVRKQLGVEVEEPEEIVEEAPAEIEEIEEIGEAPDLDLSAAPDVEIDLDQDAGIEMDFGESEVEELPEVAEPALDFVEPAEEPAEEDVPRLEEDVDFITEHLTEAEVFAKYGLAEKAIEHLEMILDRSPAHLEAGERLVRLLLDEGLKDKVCEHAPGLLGAYQDQGDDESFDKWFNELVGNGFAVSPGPPVEVEIIEEGAAPQPAVTKPVAAVAEPDEEAEEEPEVTLDFEELPDMTLEEAEVEEVAELDFGDEEVAEEAEVEEEVAELDFGEEEAEVEEEAAELDFGEEEAALPDVEEVAELDFGDEEVAEEAPVEEAEVEEEVAELEFGEEEAGLPEFDEAAELDFDEEESVLPEPVAAQPPEADAELDFEMGEATALGGPAVEDLGELDFYIEQELFDEARTKLDAMLAQFPDDEELGERRARIEQATAPPPPEEVPSPKFSPEDIESELLSAIPDDDEDIELHAEPPAATSEPIIDEGDLFEDEDDFFDLASELEEELLEDEEPISLAEEEQSLEDIFREFKKGVEQQLDSEDYDTHYNLGIAYKEMGLIDEAIGEFQVASKDPARMIECCSMLGLCFLEKGMPQLAVKWYRKGLEAPEITEEENLGLLYDLGTAHLESGDTASAQKAFMEVYGVNSNYRDIVAKIKQIEEAKKS